MSTFVDALYQRYSESMCEDSSIELFIVGGFSPGKTGNVRFWCLINFSFK